MPTTVDVTWHPDPAHAGEQIFFVVSMLPSPPAGAHAWITVGGVTSPQLDTDGLGQASFPMPGLAVGSYAVTVDYAILPEQDGDSTEVDSLVALSPLLVIAAQAPSPTPTAAPNSSATFHLGEPAIQGTGNGAALTQPADSFGQSFGQVPNVDPFTGKQAADPYTGEPISARDASINDRIRAVFAQPEAVPEFVRNAVRDFYASPAIDLSGLPRSAQNLILDIFDQEPEGPLPGRGLDEFLSDTLSSMATDLSYAVRSEIADFRTVTDVGVAADRLRVQSTLDVLAPAFGVVRALAGTAELVGGVVLTIGSEGTGAGLGVAISAHGADEVVAGIRAMMGEKAQSLTEYVLTDMGQQSFGPNAALVASGFNSVLSAGAGSAGSFAPELLGDTAAFGRSATEFAAVRTELSEASQISEAGAVRPTAIAAMEGSAEFSRPSATGRLEALAPIKVEQEIAQAPARLAPMASRTEAAILFEARDSAIETARLLVQDELDSGRTTQQMAEARFGTWLDALAKSNIRQAVADGLLPNTFVTSPTVAINRGYLRPWISAPDVWDTATGSAWDFMPASEKAFFAHEGTYLGKTASGRLDPGGTVITDISPLFHSGFR